MLRSDLQLGFQSGLRKGWGAFLWMAKILVPISFLTTVLAWCGLVGHLVVVLKPVMGLLSLPAEAALPIIIGVTTNIYGAIAAMTVLPFSKAQMTLMAIFVLTAHSLIQESVIQGKSGLNPLKAAASRLTAAFVTVLCVAPFLDTGGDVAVSTAKMARGQPFLEMILQWGGRYRSPLCKDFCHYHGYLDLARGVKGLGLDGNDRSMVASFPAHSRAQPPGGFSVDDRRCLWIVLRRCCNC